ncbi:hypothetical protein OIO90_002044 [Microbotryomycetes sp. JL221]|nr:hypothetical protein OIO90_002044 [Microbotryomycetes sp. JL221]
MSGLLLRTSCATCHNAFTTRSNQWSSIISYFPKRLTARILSTTSIRKSRSQILLMDKIQLAKQDLDKLKQDFDVLHLDSSDRQQFLKDCKTKYKDVEGLYRHFKGPATKVTGLFDKQLVNELPDKLKFICHNGAGYDQIDVSACTERKIQVSNVPTVVDDATADTALFLLLGTIREFGLAQQNLRQGQFNTGLQLSHDPKGLVLGVLGLGGIGRAFAKRCQALGMKVQYHNRHRLSPELEQGAIYVDNKDKLLQTSDVVSLNLPLNDQTRHTIGKREFELMKPTSILINTARGPVVDEQALVEALEQGQIRGCGLDVFENEPKVSQGLLKNDKAFLLPHVGTLTVETQSEMETFCLDNLRYGFEHGRLRVTVPEQQGQF